MKRLPCLLLASLAAPLAAHELQFEQGPAAAQQVQLHYADGQPFAFEAYEIYPVDGDTPLQVGRTDALGRVVFLADQRGTVRLKVFSADGHGLDKVLTLAPTASPAPPEQVSAPPPSRSGQLLTGLGWLLGIFGVVQLFIRRRK